MSRSSTRRYALRRLPVVSGMDDFPQRLIGILRGAGRQERDVADRPGLHTVVMLVPSFTGGSLRSRAEKARHCRACGGRPDQQLSHERAALTFRVHRRPPLELACFPKATAW